MRISGEEIKGGINVDVKRLHPECISCMTKVHLEKCPKEADDDKKVEYMQRVLKVLAEAPERFGAYAYEYYALEFSGRVKQ